MLTSSNVTMTDYVTFLIYSYYIIRYLFSNIYLKLYIYIIIYNRKYIILSVARLNLSLPTATSNLYNRTITVIWTTSYCD